MARVVPLKHCPPALTRRQENYARCCAAGMSYSEAFRQAGLLATTPGSMARQIRELNRIPKVRARIDELRAKADQETVSTIAERMAWLRLVVQGDPEELSKIVTYPCPMCWTEETIATEYSAHFAANPFNPDDDETRAPLPDVTKPRGACHSCRGEGQLRVVLTPTDELSPAARALFKGAKQKESGEIEIYMHDKIAAADMLNKMQSSYVTRSLNINANVAVHAAKDISTEEAAKLFDAFGGGPST